MLLVQAIVTALLSGLFSGAILFGLNERRDRADAEYRYLEELFSSFAAFCSAVEAYHKQIWELAHPSYDFYVFDSKSTEISNKYEEHWARTDFLVGAWAPELRDIAHPVFSVHQTLLNGRRLVLEKRLATGAVDADDFAFLGAPLVQLHQARINGLNRITAKVRALSSRPLLLPQGLRQHLWKRIRNVSTQRWWPGNRQL